MKQFKIGNKYQTRSICDHDCIFEIEVTGRTKTMIKYKYEGVERKSKIRIIDDLETIRPDNYSMAPTFKAY